jgi:hypothetical protein
VIACLLLTSACVPTPESGIVVVPTTVTTPQWPDAADPFVLPDGGQYHVFSSHTIWGGTFRMPVRTVEDLTRVYSPQEWVDVTVEGMPVRPAWSSGADVFWAPTVARAADGRYVAFFVAERRDPPNPRNPQCIGRAIAPRPEGPYTAEPGPFTCGLHGVGGAIDPSLVQAADGQWFLHATFDNTDFNVWAFGLDGNLDQDRDVYGLAGYWPVPVFWRSQPWEGFVMENPAMIRDPYSGSYALAYSAVDYWYRPTHAVGVARCAGPLGGCTGATTGPWIVRGEVGTGPGGLSFFTDFDGSLRAVYASWPPGGEYYWPRRATVAAVRDVATRPTLVPIAEIATSVSAGRVDRGAPPTRVTP